MDLIDRAISDTEDSEFHDFEVYDEPEEEERARNRELVKRFPFLLPRNVWSGRKITDGAGFWPGAPEKVPEYNYEYTLLDFVPTGWRKAFGEEMCEEIEQELEKHGIQDKYYPTQIKEKYGTLRWYSNFSTEALEKILEKYEDLSERLCISCGKPATQYTVNWISPYCDDCAQRVGKYDRLISAQEYWQDDD